MKFDFFRKISFNLLIFISFGEAFKLTQKNKSRVTYDVNSLVDVKFYANNYHGNEIIELETTSESWKNGEINQEKITSFKNLLEKILLNFITRLPEAKINDTLPIIGTHSDITHYVRFSRYY